MRTGLRVAAGLALGAALAGCAKKAEPTAGPAAPPGPKPDEIPWSRPPAMTQYTVELATNPGGVVGRFGGQVVELHGTVDGVSLTAKGLVAVTVLPEGVESRPVVCRTPKLELIGDAVRGRAVHLKGRVDPAGTGAELADAEVLTWGPDTAVRLSADELAAAAADLPALLARCDGKSVVVTGTFDRLMKDGPSQQEFAQLRTAGPVRVMGVLAPGYRYQLSEPGQARRFKLDPGDAVCWVGTVSRTFTDPTQFVLDDCVPRP